GYAADAALTAKAVISGAGVASKSGVGLRSRPRIAKQSRKIQQMAGRACSNQTAVGFFIAPDGSLLLSIG
ncbi:MAG: hypothetical protein IJU12_08980, partial [Clostridia bacterium]|nr:hypothetical protein [Clostridia bacterium]